MDDNQFFKNIWRFNSLIILGTGLLAITVLLYSLFAIARDLFRTRAATNVVNIEETPNAPTQLQMGNVTRINGSPFVYVPLKSGQNYDQSYYEKSTLSTRNILFINSETDSQYWLFNVNDYLIPQIKPLALSNDADALAILYSIVKADTNNDQRLTHNDRKTIAISRADGTGYREVLADVDVMVGETLTSQDTVLLVYQKDQVAYSANIDLSTLSLLRESELPKVGQDQ